MKRLLFIFLAIVLTLPASAAQVGRYRNIRIWYPGYSLKLDTATGELWAVHYDKELDKTIEEVISGKQSHNHRQIGRYEFRRTGQVGTYQVFDTSSGEYTTVKWKPKNKDGEEVGIDVDSLMQNAGEGLKRFLKQLGEDLERIYVNAADSAVII